jgi:hypothetical protein
MAEPTLCCTLPGSYCARIDALFNHDGVHVFDVGWHGDRLALTIETQWAVGSGDPVDWAFHTERLAEQSVPQWCADLARDRDATRVLAVEVGLLPPTGGLDSRGRPPRVRLLPSHVAADVADARRTIIELNTRPSHSSTLKRSPGSSRAPNRWCPRTSRASCSVDDDSSGRSVAVAHTATSCSRVHRRIFGS